MDHGGLLYRLVWGEYLEMFGGFGGMGMAALVLLQKRLLLVNTRTIGDKRVLRWSDHDDHIDASEVCTT